MGLEIAFFPPLREKTDDKTLNSYMPGLADLMPVPNLLMFRIANFGEFSTPSSPLR